MKSTDFHRQILGNSFPWKIVNVELDLEAKRVVIRVEVNRTTKWGHPDTKQPASLHKWTERTWQHLDTCQFETVNRVRPLGGASFGITAHLRRSSKSQTLAVNGVGPRG